MTRIVNIRGTNGAGKTTLAKAIMSKLVKVKDYTTKNGVFTHVYKNQHGEAIVFIGKYEGAVTGGVDRVRNVRDIVEAVAEVSQFGHVVMEGLILSGLQQLTKDVADASPNSTFHAITLSTSKEQCIEQTLKRRELAGNEKPFDPAKSLLPKYRAVELAAAKLKSWGLDSIVVSQRDGFRVACELLNIPYSEANAL
jgi:ATPase subunit of ABC transporter with duplicated ATPase domains